MSKVNVKAKSDITIITGLPGSGKSTYIDKHYLQKPSGRAILIVDPAREYKESDNYTIFRIKNYEQKAAGEEFEKLAAYLLKHPDAVDLLIIDESNVILPKKQLYSATAKMLNTLRHLRISIVAVARRPTDINITASELASKRIIFKSTGKNDIQYLNNIEEGLGDRAAALRLHEYIVWKP